MSQTVSDRLILARQTVGYGSASEAARALGLAESTYMAHENGQRGLRPATAEQYARRFNVSLEWLLTGHGQMRRTAQRVQPSESDNRVRGVIMVPLLDTVTAGRLKTPSSQIPLEDVPLLAFADLGRGDWFALRVDEKGDGDSMDRVSPPGSTILVNRADRALINNRCYIFSIDGETTYKMWQDGDPPYLAPYSTNPNHRPIFVKRRKDFDVIGRVKRTVLDL